MLTPGDGHDFDFEPPRAMVSRTDHGKNRHLGLIAYALGILVVTDAGKSSTLNILAFLFDRPETRSNLTWLPPLCVATFSPILLSTLIWWLVCTSRATWRLHLIFVPTAISLFVCGISLFQYCTREVGVVIDGMKEADAIGLGGSYLLLSLLVHIVTLLSTGIAALRCKLGSR